MGEKMAECVACQGTGEGCAGTACPVCGGSGEEKQKSSTTYVEDNYIDLTEGIFENLHFIE